MEHIDVDVLTVRAQPVVLNAGTRSTADRVAVSSTEALNDVLAGLK